MHFPVTALFTGSFRGDGCGHGVTVDLHQGIVPEFELHLVRISPHQFGNNRMVRLATRALVVAKLQQSYRSFGGAAHSPDCGVRSQRLHKGAWRILRVSPAKIHGCARGHGNCDDDNDNGFQSLRHAPNGNRNGPKKLLQSHRPNIQFGLSCSFETSFLVAIGYSSQGR
jgi:hypothetical protein